MAIDDRIIDEVSAATDIVQLIASYIPVKRAGTNYKALCPFHQEKTPSFMISPHKQIFHCFGCGAGGNAFGFLMRYENMTFPETVRHLAEKVGITIPEASSKSKEEVSRTRILSDIYQTAAEYYRANYVDTHKGRGARAYLQKRGFLANVVDFFSIGFAIPEWRGLYDYLHKKGFPEDSILRSGLIVQSAKSTPFDFFKGRLIFPIVNVKDKVVAFGGRTLGSEEPKYINTPETEHFRKRYELYGLNWAKREITQAGETVIIVEGYLDVMRLFQIGIKNAIAPLGTALTQDHVRVLKRYAEKVLMVFDGDSAGLNASLRSLNAFLEESVCVEVVTLPPGHDPDSFVREKGDDAFRKVLTSAQDVFDFKLNALLAKYNKSDSLGLIKITNEMFEMLFAVKNAVLRDRYIRQLSERLAINEASLRAELQKRKKFSSEDELVAVEEKKTSSNKQLHELNLLHIIISEPSLCKIAFACLSIDDFERTEVREIWSFLDKICHDEGGIIDYNKLTNRIQNEDTKKVLSELPFLTIEEDDKADALLKRIREIKLKVFERELKDIHAHIRAAEAQHDEETLIKHQQMKIRIQNEINKLKTKGVTV